MALERFMVASISTYRRQHVNRLQALVHRHWWCMRATSSSKCMRCPASGSCAAISRLRCQLSTDRWRNSCQKWHPGWQHIFWDAERAEALLAARYAWFLPTWHSYPRIVHKGDLPTGSSTW